MSEKVWNKYIKGFKFLLPFILMQVLFSNIISNLEIIEFSFFDMGKSFATKFSELKPMMLSNLLPIIFNLIAGSLFYAFLMIIIRSIVNFDDVNYRESFKESLILYPRYLAVSSISATVFIGLIFIGLWDLAIPFIVILSILFSAVLEPCTFYLVYNDEEIIDSLKNGIAIGKRYFVEILFISIIVSVIGGAIGALIGYFIEGIVATTIKNFILYSAYMYANIYIMNICRKEANIGDKAMTLEYD